MTVPLLFGLFWGSPLLAREFEEGTRNLAWTRDVTRRRWFSANVMWALVAAAVWGGVMTAHASWWRLPENALGILPGPRITSGPFDIPGVVPIAYSIFAMALGISVVSILGRVLPAIAVALAGFVAVRVLIAHFARPHFKTQLSMLVPLASGTSDVPARAWVLSTSLVGPNGHNYGVSSTGN